MTTQVKDADPGKFVQTVLLVDDRGLSDLNPAADLEDETHFISTKDIVDTLADQGTACMVLAPGSPNDPDRERVLKLAVTADVVVLDWSLPRTPKGKKQDSQPILQALIEHDVREGGRLRLIVIYTAYELPAEIVDDAEVILKENGVTFDTQNEVIDAGDIQIVVIGKPTSSADIQTMSGTQLADALPRLFVESFATGLMRRVALASVAAIRSHAHQLLTDFTPSIDRAFASHRAMTGASAAEEFARTLVLDGFATLLEEAAVERWVGPDAVDEFLAAALGAEPPDRVFVEKHGKVKMIERDQALALMGGTCTAHDKCGPIAWDNVGSLTPVFHPAADPQGAVAGGTADDERFTGLATFARLAYPNVAGRVHPQLKLGAVVREAETFLICMQPLCDAVRLPTDSDTYFPFLPLRTVKDLNGKFDLVVPLREGGSVRLVVASRLRDLRLIALRPDGGDAIVAKQGEDGVRTFVVHDGEPLEWLGQLRLDHAHRLAAGLGISVSRIGLDEPEWSRRRAARG